MFKFMKFNFPFSSFPLGKVSWSRFRYYGIANLIFLTGLLFSFVIFRFYQTQDLQRSRVEFDRITDLCLFLIKDILLDTLEQMEYIKQFYYSSNAEISVRDFSIFVRSIFNLYPNYLALGWTKAPSLPSSSSIPSSIGLDFIDLSQDKPTQSHFFPLTYLEKSKWYPNFYIHLNDYPVFLSLLKNSENNLGVTISDSITYKQGEKKQGFFLFTPVFSKELNFFSSENKLFGTIIGLSNFEDIVENIRYWVDPTRINISIYDVAKENDILLYQHSINDLNNSSTISKEEIDLQKQWTHNQIFKFGNRIWKLQATPTLAFIRLNQQPQWLYWEIPIIGTLVSILMSSYFLFLANRRILIEKEVHDRTRELAKINDILQQEILERQRVEEDFTTKQHYLQRRHEALEYLTKLTTLEPRNAIHEVILRTAVVMQVNRVSVWFYEIIEQTQILSRKGLYILSNNSFSNHLKITSDHFPRYFLALSKRSHLIFPSPRDAELNKELSSYLAISHINSKLDIPIVFEGNLLGVLSCEETRGHREWALEDRHFGQTIADIIAIMIEQSARRKAEKALKESEERLRFITQRSIDGIVSINEKEEIVSWNYGAQQMFGYNEVEVLGKSLRMIIPQDDFFLQHEFSTKPTALQGRHRDGHLFPVEISQTRWKSEEAHFDTIIIRDITERKEYEKRLIKAMRDAKAANAAKSEFLATISHELRTPLNAIIGFNQCLLMGMDGPISQLQQESLKKIEKSSFHLLNLISDILDWSKIEAKKMELEITSQNIIELLSSCIEEMQPLAQQKKLDIQLSINKDFILVEMDRLRIKQVLLNLLSNAIKFTEKGHIQIVLINEARQVHIQIKDTGIGLSEEEIEKIFHPFSQADSSITRKYGGTGLGLVISKNIMDLHGGTIKVQSQKGKGSTFTISLPKNQ